MSEANSAVLSARVAFAGLPELREEMFRAALRRRPDIEVVVPWTDLPSLYPDDGHDVPEILVVELRRAGLPRAMRAMLSAATRLRIMAISADARTAVIYRLIDEHTVLLDRSPTDLCALMDAIR